MARKTQSRVRVITIQWLGGILVGGKNMFKVTLSLFQFQASLQLAGCPEPVLANARFYTCFREEIK
jgi:hypothetical protein